MPYNSTISHAVGSALHRATLVADSVAFLLVLQLAGAAAPSTVSLAVTSGRGDVNCDEATNAIDAALILQYNAGLLDELPVGS